MVAAILLRFAYLCFGLTIGVVVGLAVGARLVRRTIH